MLKGTLAEKERKTERGMCDSKVQANVLSRLKRHASDGEDKIGSPGSIVNAVARELHRIIYARRRWERKSQTLFKHR